MIKRVLIIVFLPLIIVAWVILLAVWPSLRRDVFGDEKFPHHD